MVAHDEIDRVGPHQPACEILLVSRWRVTVFLAPVQTQDDDVGAAPACPAGILDDPTEVDPVRLPRLRRHDPVERSRERQVSDHHVADVVVGRLPTPLLGSRGARVSNTHSVEPAQRGADPGKPCVE